MISEKKLLDLIADQIKAQKLSNTEVAYQLRIHPSSLSGFFKRGSVRLNRIIQFSEVLNYNFLQEAANRIDIPTPAPVSSEKEELIRLKNENEEQKERIKELEMKIRLLEETYEGFMKGIFNR